MIKKTPILLFALLFSITISNTLTIEAIEPQTSVEDIPFTYEPIITYDGDPANLEYELSVNENQNVVSHGYQILFNTIFLQPIENFNGIINLTFTVSEENGELSASRSFPLEVTPFNDAPVLTPIDTVTFDEDMSASTILSGSDVDGDDLTYSITEGVDITATLDGTTITFTASQDFNGSEDFTATVTDGEFSSSQTFTVIVNAVNDQPTANSGSNTVAEDTTADITLTGYDIDGDNLSFALDTDATNGTVSVDGSLATYTPNANYNGDDSFTFTVSDGSLSAMATITITVTPVNDVPDLAVVDAVSFDEDGSSSISLSATDDDGDDLTYSITEGVDITATLDGTTITFTASQDFNGSEDFTATVEDTTSFASQSFTVTVLPINDEPIAYNSTETVVEDDEIQIQMNAYDVDGDELTYHIIDPPTNGQLLNQSNSIVTYNPNQDYDLTDSFTFRVHDGDYYSNIATVSINITPENDDPVIVNLLNLTNDLILNNGDQITIDEDTTIDIQLNAVDVDNDFEDLIFYHSQISDCIDCIIEFDDSTMTIDPPLNYNGQFSISINVFDGFSNVPDAFTLNVIVNPINDPPEILNASTLNFDEDTLGIIDVIYSDVENDDITDLEIIGGTEITATPDGATITFTASQDWHGFEVFTLQITEDIESNPLSDQIEITVTVNSVNDLPTITHIINQSDNAIIDSTDTVTIEEDNTASFQIVGDDVETEINDLVYGATCNNCSEATDGNIIDITPDPDYNGLVDIVFTVQDEDGGNVNDAYAITLNVTPVNDAPEVINGGIIDGGVLNAMEDDPDITIPLIGAFWDVENINDLIYTVNDTYDESLINITVDNDNDELTIDFLTNQNGITEVAVTADDNTRRLTVTDTFYVNVIPRNDPPIIDIVETQFITEDTNLPLTLTGSDVDNSNNELTFSTSSDNDKVQVDVNSDGSYFTATPDNNYNGSAIITIRVDDIEEIAYDNNGNSVDSFSEHDFILNISPDNDAPYLDTINAQSVAEDTPINIVSNVSDPDAISDLNETPYDLNDLTFTCDGNQINCEVNNNSNGEITLTIFGDTHYNGVSTITVHVHDEDIDSNHEIQFDLTVEAINDPPTFPPDFLDQFDNNYIFNEDPGILPEIDLQVNDVDNDDNLNNPATDLSGSHTFIISPSENINPEINNDNYTLTFDPELHYNGQEVFNLSVTDGKDTTSHTIIVEVEPVDDITILSDETLEPIIEDFNSFQGYTPALSDPDVNDQNNPFDYFEYNIILDPDLGSVDFFNPSNGGYQFDDDSDGDGYSDFNYLTANHSKTVNFTYRTTSQLYGSNSDNDGTITLTVNGENDQPISYSEDVHDGLNEDEDYPGIFPTAFDFDNDDGLGPGSHIDIKEDGYQFSEPYVGRGDIVIDGTGYTFYRDGDGDGYSDFDYLSQGEEEFIQFHYYATDQQDVTSEPSTIELRIAGIEDITEVFDNEGDHQIDEDETKSWDVPPVADADSSDSYRYYTYNNTGNTADAGHVTFTEEYDNPTFTFATSGDFNNLRKDATRLRNFQYHSFNQWGNESINYGTISIMVTGTNDNPEAYHDLGNNLIDEDNDLTDTLVPEPDDADNDDGDGANSHNNIDPGGYFISPSYDNNAGNGTLTFNNTGTYDFVTGDDFHHLTAEEDTTITFTYYATDKDDGQSNPANIDIFIQGINDPTTIYGDDSALLYEDDVEMSFETPTLDDLDINDTYTYYIDSGVDEGYGYDIGNGYVKWADNGENGRYRTYIFNEDGDFQNLTVGTAREVTFDYHTVNQNGSNSNTSTITITVIGDNDNPNFSGDDYYANEDDDFSWDLVETNHHATDIDTDNGQGPGTYDDVNYQGYELIDISTDKGTLNFENTGSGEFRPGSDFDYLTAEEDTTIWFTSRASDLSGGISDPSQSNITIQGINDPTTVYPYSFSLDETDLNVEEQVPDLDDDDFNDQFIYRIHAGQPAQGFVEWSDSTNGTFIFYTNQQDDSSNNPFEDLTQGTQRTVEFQYKTYNQNAIADTSNVETVTINVTGVNNQPEANDIFVETTEDAINENAQSYTISTILPPTDPDTDNIGDDFNGSAIWNDIDEDSYEIISTSGIHGGELEYDNFSSNGQFSFNPLDDFQYLAENEDTTVFFTYTVRDKQNIQSIPKTVTIRIQGVNDDPVITTENSNNRNVVFTDFDESQIAIPFSANRSYNNSINGNSILNINYYDVDRSDTHQFKWTIIDESGTTVIDETLSAADSTISFSLPHGDYNTFLEVHDGIAGDINSDNPIGLDVSYLNIALDDDYKFVTSDIDQSINITISETLDAGISSVGDYYEIIYLGANNSFQFSSIQDNCDNCIIENNNQTIKIPINYDDVNSDGFVPNSFTITKQLNIETLTDESDFLLGVRLDQADLTTTNYIYNFKNNYAGTEIIRIGSPRIDFLNDESYVLEDATDIDAGPVYIHTLNSIIYNDSLGVADDFINISLPENSDLIWDGGGLPTFSTDKILFQSISENQKTMHFNIITEEYDTDEQITFNNLRVKTSVTVPPTNLLLDVNHQDNVDYTTLKNIRIGSPKIEYISNSKQIFYNNGDVTLEQFDDIVYSEDPNVGVAGGLNEMIKIYLPSNTNMDFNSDLISCSSDYYDGNIDCWNYGDALYIELDGDYLDGGDEIVISNIKANIDNEYVNTYLELEVNQRPETDYRYNMQNQNYIRVGRPTILSEGDHTFVTSNGLSDVFNTITISESDNSSCITSNDGISIKIPDAAEITWDTTLVYQDLTFSGNAISKIDDIAFINEKELKIYINQDFETSDYITIDSGLLVYVSNTPLETDEYKLGLEINSRNEWATGSQADTEDTKFIAISTPNLYFPNDIGMVVNASGVDNPQSFGNIYINDNSTYNTIKKNERITISLPQYPSDLTWNYDTLDNNDIFTNCDNNGYDILFEKSDDSDSKNFIFVPLADFDGDCRIEFTNNLKINPPTSRINSDHLSFTVRNRTSAESTLISENLSNPGNESDKCFWVSKPTINSTKSQIFYVQSDEVNDNAYPIIPIKILDDSVNPVFYVTNSNENNNSKIVDNIYITLPESSNLLWNTNDDYMYQIGTNLSSLSNQVNYTPDQRTLIIDVVNTFNNTENDSILIGGLSVIPSNNTTGEQLASISFNNALKSSFYDENDWYVGELDIYSSEPNIILKGDNTINQLSSIIIKDLSEDPRLESLNIILPPELQINFSDIENIDFSESTEELTNQIRNRSGDGTSIFSFDILNPNLWNQNDSLILKNINYTNSSSSDAIDISSRINIEVYDDIYIQDKEKSFLTSIIFESDERDRIFFKEGAISDYLIHDIKIGNNPIFYNSDSLKLVNAQEQMSIALPDDIDIYWSDGVENNLIVYDSSNNNITNNIFEFLSVTPNRKELYFNVLNDLGDTQWYISNLRVDIESNNSTSNLKLKNISQSKYIGFNKYSIDCALPTIDLNNNKTIRMNAELTKAFKDITINESDIHILDDGFSIYIADTLHNASQILSFNYDLKDGINVIYNSNDITDEFNIEPSNENSNYLEFTLLDSVFNLTYPLIIENIPFIFNIDKYDESYNYIANISDQKIMLSFSEHNSNNYTVSDSSISIKPSIFFNEPKVYYHNGESKITFPVKSNFFNHINTDDLRLFLNKDLNTESLPSPEYSNYSDPKIHNTEYDDVINLTFPISDSLLHAINIEYDRLNYVSNTDVLKIVNIDDTVDVEFYNPALALDNVPLFGDDAGWTPSSLNSATPISINPDSTSIIQIDDYQLPNTIPYKTNLHLLNYETEENEVVLLENNTEYFDLRDFSNINKSGLYIMKFQNSFSDLFEPSYGDTSSIFFEKFINIDYDAPNIYTDIFSDEFSINPLPGLKPDSSGHDISEKDVIKFTVIDGPSYFNENYVLQDSSLIVFPYDLTYVFDNTVTMDMEVFLNDSIILLNNPTRELNLNSDFNTAYYFNNQLLQLAEENRNGILTYRISSTDGADNTITEDFVYQLQDDNNISIDNFFNYPNPFNANAGEITSFRYTLAEQINTGKLTLFDMAGRILYTYNLNNNQLEEGTHVIPWDGTTNSEHILGSGVYYAIITFNSKLQSKLVKVAIVND